MIEIVNVNDLNIFLIHHLSEEGEIKEDHCDSSYILDDEKHRAKNDQSYRNFSSESEIYGEKINNSSPEHDGNIQINFRYKIII
jgi:hypothetical protein